MKIKNKKIRNIGSEVYDYYNRIFSYVPGSVVTDNQVPSFLTSSEELQDKTVRVEHLSGAIVSGIGDIGKGLKIYRYDESDSAKGFPINTDVYEISGSALIQFQPPFPGHWLSELEESMPIMLKEEFVRWLEIHRIKGYTYQDVNIKIIKDLSPEKLEEYMKKGCYSFEQTAKLLGIILKKE